MSDSRKGKAGKAGAGNGAKDRQAAPARSGPKVLIVSPEIVPLAKTGGLADVAGSLPLALKGLGCDVRVAMPMYKNVIAAARPLAELDIPMGRAFIEITRELKGNVATEKTRVVYPGKEVSAKAVIMEAALRNDLPAYLIANPGYFGRDQLYGYPDDVERFGFFSRAVLEMPGSIGWTPDVIHCNDWQSAMVPTYLKLFYKPAGRLTGVGTLLTVHNMEYQGNFDRSAIDVLGLGWELFNMEGVEFWGQVSMMKAGILYSDMVNTVSENYAREIQTPEFGGRMDGVLKANAEKVRGILNGIDYDMWDPSKDDALDNKFNIRSVGLRPRNKAALQRELGLKQDPQALLLGFIGRLAVQKGLDILVPAIPDILCMGCQLVALGTGDDHYMKKMAEIAGTDPERLSVILKFDDRTARRIYGGCDAFLMPSRYEPCGLGQMISFRYGAVPLVRKTGGLADTVKDALMHEDGTGFIFEDYSTDALSETVRKAREVYADDARWKAITLQGMRQDFSWNASAGKYLDLYREVIRRARQS
jgi:starch synthase